MDLTNLTSPLPLQPALSKNVVDSLRGMLASGALAPGEHLKEAELAAALGVSRGPVREALAELAHEGHVELRRHRGAFVSQLTRRDVHELYSLRLALERLAVERAATHITSDQLEQLDAVLERMRRVGDDYTPDEAVELSLAFHDLLYEAADHRRLWRSWQFIRSNVAFFLHTRNARHHDFVDVGYADHKVLRDVLAAGDPRKAVALIEKHLQGPYTYLLADLPEDQSD